MNSEVSVERIIRIARRLPLLAAIPAVLVIRVMSPLLLIRIGQSNAGRIGHFAMDTELAICQRKTRTQNSKFPIIVDLFFIDGNVSNEYLLRLWEQVITYYPKWLLQPIHRLNQKLPGARKFNVFGNVTHLDLTLLDSTDASIHISQSDEASALEILKEIGIEKDDKIVCFCVRDNAYLRSAFPADDWSEHDHRDSEVQDYVLAAKALESQGYKVLRMGKIVNDKLQTDSTLIIDYANSAIRSDMLDVYLFSKAKFIISNSTGMDFLGALFRVPIGLVNVVSPKSIAEGKIIRLYQPKEFHDKATDEILSLEQLLKRGFASAYNKRDFVSMGVEIINNSPEEIRDFALEFQQIAEDDLDISYIADVQEILERNHIGNRNLAKISRIWLSHHPRFIA